jgi:hypothetical protein
MSNEIESQETETKEKRKRDSQNVEWQFDFANLGESFKNLVGSLAGDEETQHATFKHPIDGASSAAVEIGFSIGKGSIRPLLTSSNLIEADITYVGEVEFEVEGEQHKRVKLAQKNPKNVLGPIRQGFRALADRKDLEWNIGLASGIPLDLSIDGGVGPIEADLTGLTVKDLDIDSGVGTMHVTLPVQDAALHTEIDSGVGQLTIIVPEGAHGTLDIEGGVGEVKILVSPNAAVYLEAESGLGSVQTPDNMKRISGKSEFLDNSGEWRTEGYELAQRRLRVKFDGGVGSFRIAHHRQA